MSRIIPIIRNFLIHCSVICKPYYLRKYSTASDTCNFKEAVETLNKFISNAKDLQNVENRQFNDARLIQGKKFMAKCGVDLGTLSGTFRIVHISGTKGKGSTAAFCENILIKYGLKTGLFTSPHLKSVEERIRINGHSISRAKFAKYFWDLYKVLPANKQADCDDRPTFFIFVFVMALKIFYEEKVNVAIIEVGIGGEYDSTNMFSTADVVGITSLGFEHTQFLGNTMEEIAWQKTGIMKPGTIAIVSADQPVASRTVFKNRATERKCYLYEAPPLNQYHWKKDIPKLGIDGPCQHLNASVALQIVNALLNPDSYKNTNYVANKSTIPSAPVFPISKRMIDGLTSCRWPGRTQILKYSSRIIFYLDGAHTVESIQQCVQWYCERLPREDDKNKRTVKKILIFNVIGNRSPTQFFELLKICNFDYVYFCSVIASRTELNVSNDVDVHDDSEHLNELSKEWTAKVGIHLAEMEVKTFKSVLETLDHIKQLQASQKQTNFHILVTGSLHLVGNALSLLENN